MCMTRHTRLQSHDCCDIRAFACKSNFFLERMDIQFSKGETVLRTTGTIVDQDMVPLPTWTRQVKNVVSETMTRTRRWHSCVWFNIRRFKRRDYRRVLTSCSILSIVWNKLARGHNNHVASLNRFWLNRSIVATQRHQHLSGWYR